MERPGRIGAVVVVATSLAALSVYLLTHPGQVLPPAPANGSSAPLTDALLQLAGPADDARLALSAALGAANVALLYLVMARTGVARSTAAWLSVAFAFGTAHWWSAAAGDERSMSHLLAVALALAALWLALAGRPAVLAGLLIGLAAGARLPALGLLPLLAALYVGPPGDVDEQAAPSFARLAPVTLLFVAAALPALFVGYAPMGELALTNAAPNVHAALLTSFHVAQQPPWLAVNLGGTSLLLTTPLYAWLVRARSQAPVVTWGWLAAAVVLALVLLAPPAVGPQFGVPSSLDLAPLLFLLLAWVFRAGMTVPARWAVAISVAVNTYGMIAVGVLEPPFVG